MNKRPNNWSAAMLLLYALGICCVIFAWVLSMSILILPKFPCRFYSLHWNLYIFSVSSGYIFYQRTAREGCVLSIFPWRGFVSVFFYPFSHNGLSLGESFQDIWKVSLTIYHVWCDIISIYKCYHSSLNDLVRKQVSYKKLCIQLPHV